MTKLAVIGIWTCRMIATSMLKTTQTLGSLLPMPGHIAMSLIGVILFTFAGPCSMSLLRRLRASALRAPKTVRMATSSISAEGSGGDLLPVSPMPPSSSSVADLRKEYSKQGLVENDSNVQAGPFVLFTSWLNDACAAKVVEPNAMCLATCVNNIPSSRYVLLKGFDRRGFVWYTNYESRKGQELTANPNGCITFWWGELERSVRIEGIVEPVSKEESDAYFQSRPRGSQLGAWSSNQSRQIDSRVQLEAQEASVISQYGSTTSIPRPPHWGGFRLTPRRIEFWKGRESRLHDRLVFERDNLALDTWQLKRLQP